METPTFGAAFASVVRNVLAAVVDVAPDGSRMKTNGAPPLRSCAAALVASVAAAVGSDDESTSSTTSARAPIADSGTGDDVDTLTKNRRPAERTADESALDVAASRPSVRAMPTPLTFMGSPRV